MKIETAVAGTLALALAAALATPASASPREYRRGYVDCLNGRYDEDAQSRAYREGCRDAEREQEGGPAGRPPGPGWGANGGGQGWNGGGGQGWNGGGGQGWNGGGGQGWNGGGGQGWNGGGGPRPGPGPAGGIPNVTGFGAGQVMAAMAGRGYRNVGTEIAGAAIYGFYFNPATGECVQVASLNGRAVGATPTTNPRCR